MRVPALLLACRWPQLGNPGQARLLPTLAASHPSNHVHHLVQASWEGPGRRLAATTPPCFSPQRFRTKPYLDLIKQHALAGYFESWVDAAKGSGGNWLCDAWLSRL